MKREVKIGLFTVLMILCAWGGIRFLSGVDLLSKNNDYYAYYDQSGGVQNASSVFIKGVKVGSVTDISLDPAGLNRVRIKFTVSSKYKIPKDSEAKIYSAGMLNPKAVEFILGESTDYLHSGDEINASRDLDLFDVAGSELEYLKDKLEELTFELTRTLNNVSTLIELNSTNINLTLANLTELSENMNSMVEANEAAISSMAGNFSQFSEGLAQGTPKIDSILTNMNTLTTELANSDIANSLGNSLKEFEALSKQLNSKDGNVGRLLNDEALYGNLTSATENLDALLLDVKENPARYVNISVFGSSDEKRRERAEKRARKEAEERAKDSLNDLRKLAR